MATMTELSGFTWLIIAWTILGLVIAGVQILKPVNRGELGFFLVILFGPLGLVIAWAVRENNLLEQRNSERIPTADSRPLTVPVRDDHAPSLVPLSAPLGPLKSREEAESELARFDVLRQQGVVTQAEFDRRRRELLGLGR
jgi:hypothetical protein